MDQRYREPHLTDRQRALLSIIVEEYVTSARPVASEHLVSSYGLNVSSATVRNEMVELERMGLIVQPHTSAGRVPTDRGYRYFVENLMTPSSLPASEQRQIRHQFHQIEMDADEWVRLATAVLARTVHSAAVATPPRSIEVRLKHFELFQVSDTRILIVLVGQEGSVAQQMVTVPENWEQSELSSLAARLNNALQGKTASEVEEWAKEPTHLEAMPVLAREVLGTLVTTLSRLQQPDASHIYREGLGHMLSQPEFRQPEKVQQLLELFEHGSVWASIITSALNQEGVQVIIGDEDLRGEMASCSVVLARYGLGDKMTGVLGVLGPTRMPYRRSISTVSYMSQLLSDLLYKAYTSQTIGDTQ